MLIQRVKNKIATMVGLEINSFYDYLFFKKHYTKNSRMAEGKEKLEAWILQDKHRIEKAFTLPETRFCFGKEVIPRLISVLNRYKQSYGCSQVYYIGIGALKAYSEFHYNKGVELPDFYLENISLLDESDMEHELCNLAGYGRKISQGESKTENNRLSYFIKERRSCRNFDITRNSEINAELLEKITALSIYAPSVCNRQHWRIHFFSGDKKNIVLKYQNGNAGFQQNIPFIAVVTSDIRAFYSADERNQPFTDGGIFAMNVMYAMQEFGLSSCPLNWCNSAIVDKKFRKLGFIPKNEAIVLVIAFGFSSEDAIYAKSPRLSVDNFYEIHV